jgi:hypothetical protein
MLRITEAQHQQFQAHLEGSYESRAVALLAEFYPESLAKMGPEAARELVRRGINSAYKYGMVTEQQVCLFTTLMVEFGPDFDLDPAYSWAAEILQDPSSDAAVRTEALFKGAVAWLETGMLASSVVAIS